MSIASEAGVKAFIDGFPRQPRKILGKPTFLTLQDLLKDIKENATSVSCPLGGGAHGYLGAVLSPAKYATIAQIAFIIPTNPGTMAVVIGNTSALRDAELRQFNMEKKLFSEFVNITGRSVNK
jgi:hypothetical protein